MNTLATAVLLLSHDIDLDGAGVRGFEEKRYRIDSKLVNDLYSICPKDLKVALVRTPAVFWLEPRAFKPLFLDAYRLEALSAEQQESLAYSLHTFLQWHEAEANDYKDVILELLRSRRWMKCLPALHLAGLLDDLEARDLELIKRKLSQRVELRMNALNGLCRFLKRHREVSPRVLAFCTSPEVVRIARRIHRKDPDRNARTCAGYFLAALREVPAPGRRPGGSSP